MYQYDYVNYENHSKDNKQTRALIDFYSDSKFVNIFVE